MVDPKKYEENYFTRELKSFRSTFPVEGNYEENYQNNIYSIFFLKERLWLFNWSA